MLSETKMTTQIFFRKVLSAVAKKVYLVDFETAVKLVSVNLRTLHHQILHEKLLERLLEVDLADEELQKVDFKLFSYLIWCLCEAPDKEKVDPVFARYELLIDLKPSLTLKDISHTLWAITLKYKISVSTFKKLVTALTLHLEGLYGQPLSQLALIWNISQLSALLTKSKEPADQETLEEELGTWDIMNIMWGLSKFDTPEVDLFIKLLCPFIQVRLQYFTAAELVMIFRVLTEKDYLNQQEKIDEPQKQRVFHEISEESKAFYLKFLDQLITISPQMEDGQILVIMYQLVNCPHLQFTDHNDRLKRLFEIREELKKKIEVQKGKIEETVDIQELEEKRARIHGTVGRSNTRSNLTNKPF